MCILKTCDSINNNYYFYLFKGMLQKIFQVVLCRFPVELQTHHNLQVGLDKNTLEVAGIIKSYPFVEENSSFIGALMRNYPLIYEPIDCKFIQINILSAETNQDSSIIPLYVTEFFLKQYNYDYEDFCYFKPVRCFSLDRILFGVKTAESFNWFQDKEKFSSLVKQIKEANVLCHHGDAPLPSDNRLLHSESFNFDELITLDCQPFRQGILTSKTFVILADICDISHRFEKYKSLESTSSDGTIAVDFDLLNFTSNILGLRLNPSTLPVPQTLTIKINNTFAIQIIPKPNIDFEKELLKINKDVDPLNTVFMSFNVRKKLDLKNGDWIRISLFKPMEKKVKSAAKQSSLDSIPLMDRQARLAQVCIFSSKKLSLKHFSSDDVVYISPLLWFNLNSHPSYLVQPDIRLMVEVYIYILIL